MFFGVLLIIAGLWTMASPRSWDERLAASDSAEIAALPKANPLRWFHLFWRFVRETWLRKIAWGLVQVGVGIAFLTGRGTFAIYAVAALGVAILVTRLLRTRSK
jgi:hypothetical protein